MSQTNCKNCEIRHPGCHDSCDIYKAFKNKNKELNEKQKKIQIYIILKID